MGTIITLITAHLIRPLIITILVVIVLRAIFKKKYNFENVITIIKWILIAFSVLSILFFLLTLLQGDVGYKLFIDRATGLYKYSYWFMLTCGFIVPLLLFIKRLGKSIAVLLLVAICINIGWLFETIVIYMTDSHRDYVNEAFNYERELTLIIEGAYWAVIILFRGRLNAKHDITQAA
ncbi:hypothetical protein NAF17_12925 [Mucilaginibacter sp. RB4R14]|uniref:hypothetical protein n=1 Tax=Mucilaginibacter aurantiaciroseus TaxID=2949308 RepID=UPI0020900EAC|nr:hypothetical protein [Mucilaginibacter aurantiaciroseus]MCO5936443.1 hypothetical protein [Mucilaginibacter aurantiaciroseus]